MEEKNKDKIIKPLTLKSFLAVIEASVGTEMFRHLYAKVDGEEKDILEDGKLSCAFYVSSLLAIFGLIDRLHATVNGTITALEKAGWEKTDDLKPGCVIVWDKPLDNSHNHQHIGFYLGNEMAISNSTEKKIIAKNHYTYGDKDQLSYREILAIYNHSDLN
ncbi:MAG: hypothetical protein WC893_00140 [Candidatus Paceibacterota bacterium]|jgi:hypothetical protein